MKNSMLRRENRDAYRSEVEAVVSKSGWDTPVAVSAFRVLDMLYVIDDLQEVLGDRETLDQIEAAEEFEMVETTTGTLELVPEEDD